MTKKVEYKLGHVQETLLLPLASRVAETKKRNGVIYDPKSLEVARKIDFNYRKVVRDITDFGAFSLAVRAVRFDFKIKEFLEKHPQGKVLTLGAGLDTTFYRCDNGEAIWYDLDLEDSIELREKLIPIPNERVHYLKKSLFDISWIEDIGSTENGLLIIVPGVLPYLPEEDIMNLIKVIAPRLVGGAMLFDVVSNFGALSVEPLIHAAGMKNARLLWKILDTKEIEKWSAHVKVSAEPYFKDILALKKANFIDRQLMRFNDWFSISQIVRLDFI